MSFVDGVPPGSRNTPFGTIVFLIVAVGGMTAFAAGGGWLLISHQAGAYMDAGVGRDTAYVIAAAGQAGILLALVAVVVLLGVRRYRAAVAALAAAVVLGAVVMLLPQALAGQPWWAVLAYVVSVPLLGLFDGLLILVWVAAIWTVVDWKKVHADDGTTDQHPPA